MAKNYLSDSEVDSLNHLTSSFLEMAEMRAKRHLLTKMEDWQKFLESFMSINDYELLKNNETVSSEEAQQKAFEEYDKFRLIQDHLYQSDFDNLLAQIDGMD